MIYKRRRKQSNTLVEKKVDCSKCKNAVFDEVWGEYKCKAHGIRIYDISKILSCDEYIESRK